VRELVQLVRDGDPGDLAGEPRDRLADEEAAERRRLAEGADVEREAPEQAERARTVEADLLLGRRQEVLGQG
jgi:hypothetical protein